MSPEPDPIHRLFALSVERSRMSSCLLIPVTLLGRSFITPTGGTSIWSPLLVFITVLMIAIAIMRASILFHVCHFVFSYGRISEH